MFQLGFSKWKLHSSACFINEPNYSNNEAIFKIISTYLFWLPTVNSWFIKVVAGNEVRLEVPILREFVTLLINCDAALLVAPNALIFQEKIFFSNICSTRNRSFVRYFTWSFFLPSVKYLKSRYFIICRNNHINQLCKDCWVYCEIFYFCSAKSFCVC